MLRSTSKEPDELDPAEALMREVGAQLRQVRLDRGEELEDVAEHLRIRPTYLFGIEQGDLSVMPGRTYALGFLRSYADHLGFDGDDLIAQIRSSVADLTGKTRLHMRSPLPESRLPKTPVLVLSLAVVAGIYAGWSYVDHGSQAIVDTVPEVPADLQDLARAVLPEAETGPPDRVEAPASDHGVAAPSPAVSQPEPEPAGSAIAEPPAVAVDHAADVADGEDVREPMRIAQPQAGPDLNGQTAGSAAPAPVVAGLEQPETDAATAPARPDRPSPAEVLARLEPIAGAGAAPEIYRADDADARVILRARSSSWVHVSSSAGDYLWVDTLEPGEAYVVPNRPDLDLWTGNAGGIEVIVDGTPLPPLGPSAGVMRDISLRPADLRRRLLPASAAGPAPDL